MDRPLLTPLGLLFLLYVLLINKENINFVWNHPINIPSTFGSNWPVVSEKEIKI